MKTGSLLILCTLTFALSLSFCSHQKNPIAALDILPETGGSVSRPQLMMTLPASWDENWYSSPAAFDIDNSGSKEIIASRHSVLYVWSHDGILLWRAPVGESASSANDHGTSRMYCSPVVGDLDNDGKGEIAICYSNRCAVYENDGRLRAGWPQSFPGPEGEIRSIAAADLNGDSKCEIVVVKTSDGPVTNVWTIDGIQYPGWPQVTDRESKTDYGGYNQNIGIADLDKDGLKDIVCTYDICHIGIFKASGESWSASSIFKETYSCNVPMFHKIELAIQGWGNDGEDRDEFTDSSPAFADFDNDGMPEIVLFSDHERAGEYRNRGNSLWVLNPDMTRVPEFEKPLTTGLPLYTGYADNIVQVAPAPCISNLGGAFPYVIVPSYDGYMRCYNYTGNVVWSVQFDAGGGSFTGASEPVAGDLDNDGIPEIIFTTYSFEQNRSNLVVCSSTGVLLHRVSISGRGSMAAPTLADVNGDNTIEILVSLKDAIGSGSGGVQIWSVASATAGILDWYTGRGNFLRTGSNK